jgi:hypothetical protein
MPDITLDPAEILRAVDQYLSLAYKGDPPLRARSLREVLAVWQGPALKCPAFSRDPKADTDVFTLRLGNSFYPHMKLAIQLSPRREKFIFRVDTHDRHCCPANTSPEYGAFCELMDKNQKLAQVIESEWEKRGIPTFKSYLRADLERRKATMK